MKIYKLYLCGHNCSTRIMNNNRSKKTIFISGVLLVLFIIIILCLILFIVYESIVLITKRIRCSKHNKLENEEIQIILPTDDICI